MCVVPGQGERHGGALLQQRQDDAAHFPGWWAQGLTQRWPEEDPGAMTLGRPGGGPRGQPWSAVRRVGSRGLGRAVAGQSPLGRPATPLPQTQRPRLRAVPSQGSGRSGTLQPHWASSTPPGKWGRRPPRGS